MDWKQKTLAATRGTKLGAIIRCALGVERDAVPRFVGKASVTSDGLVMCSYVDKSGEHHMGAFVGGVDDLDRNVTGLAKHLSLNAADHNALTALVASWIATDYRSTTRSA